MSGSRILVGSQSTSGSFSSKLDLAADIKFKWESVKKFIYLAVTVNSGLQTYDLFSGFAYRQNSIFFFILFQLIFGMSYLYADFFIKMYTGKLDCNLTLNPMMKGIAYGTFVQTLAWCLIHSHDLADSLYFFSSAFSTSPFWDSCPPKAKGCQTGFDVYRMCMTHSGTFELYNTTAYLNYVRLYKAEERSVLTTRLFLVGLVWMLNFFFTTINEQNIIKIIRLFFVLRFSTNMVFFLVVFLAASDQVYDLFSDMFTGSFEEYMETARFVAMLNGIGYVGVYDFGTMSPYTPIDSAVIFYSIFAIIMSLTRSLVIKLVINSTAKCLLTKHKIYTSHYVLFGLFPLSTQTLKIQTLYSLCTYLDVVLTICTSLAMATLSLGRLLHSEFQSIKSIYFIGILCFGGFFLCLPLGYIIPRYPFGVYEGMLATSYFLGAARMAIVMWLYGVDKFATDVHFWLGYKPTRYWLITWSITPIVFFFFFVKKMKIFMDMKDDLRVRNLGLGWTILILVIVLLCVIKTLASYVISGNFAGIFRSSQKYGPPEAEERKRRRRYNEAIDFRQCKHECMMLDDLFDCNHAPLKKDGQDGESSLHDIFLSGAGRRKASSVIELG